MTTARLSALIATVSRPTRYPLCSAARSKAPPRPLWEARPPAPDAHHRPALPASDAFASCECSEATQLTTQRLLSRLSFGLLIRLVSCLLFLFFGVLFLTLSLSFLPPSSPIAPLLFLLAETTIEIFDATPFLSYSFFISPAYAMEPSLNSFRRQVCAPRRRVPDSRQQGGSRYPVAGCRRRSRPLHRRLPACARQLCGRPFPDNGNAL